MRLPRDKKSLIFFCTLVLMTLLLFLLANSEMFYLQHIEVNIKSNHWPRDTVESIKNQMIQRVEKFKGQPTWKVNLNEVAKVLEQESRVSGVLIFRRLPNRMELKVKLHEPIALLMDLDGRLLPVSKDASLLPSLGEVLDLPILRGLNFHKDQKLREGALSMLEEISSSRLSGLRSLSEIRFDKKFGYVVYLLAQGARVRLGQGNFTEKIKRVEKVLHYLEDQKIAYSVIDARLLKKVVVKPRNKL